MRRTTGLLVAQIFVLGGCDLLEEEACTRLCERTTARLSDCQPEWPVEWEELGADDAQDFLATCEQDWLELRAELEPRELQDALQQCTIGLRELRKARASEAVCDDLRAVYLLD